MYVETAVLMDAGEPGAAGNVDTLVVKAPSAVDDKWALEYISVSRVQPILEAFDDDGTGFVSLREANVFTTSRPKDWTWVLFFWFEDGRTLTFCLDYQNGLLSGLQVGITLSGSTEKRYARSFSGCLT